MLRRTDRATGLTLTLDTDPEPRNPRLADDPLFHFFTWTEPRLGDAHDWPSALRFSLEMRSVPMLILPVRIAWSSDGRPGFTTVVIEDHHTAGCAFATHERLRLHYGTDDLTPELIEGASLVCDTELLAYEEFLGGDVHAFTITAPDGRVLEHCCGLFGLEWAEFCAERAFEDHLVRWLQDDGRRRPAA